MKLTIFLFTLITVTLFSCSQSEEKEINIAVSSNARFVFEELIEIYTRKGNRRPNLISGSSGKLSAQITQGAPFDLFFSADMKYPEYLSKNGFAEDEPVVYAIGRLVIFSANNSIVLNENVFNSREIKHIAIPNPESAPYGLAAMEYLKNIGVYKSVKDKLIYGESVSQTNEFILSKAAEIGITALSIMHSRQMKNHKNWLELDRKKYASIEQGMLRLETNSETDKFLNFFFSEEGQRILADFGYFSKNESYSGQN